MQSAKSPAALVPSRACDFPQVAHLTACARPESLAWSLAGAADVAHLARRRKARVRSLRNRFLSSLSLHVVTRLYLESQSRSSSAGSSLSNSVVEKPSLAHKDRLLFSNMATLRSVQRSLDAERSLDGGGSGGGRGGEWKKLRDSGNDMFDAGEYARAVEHYSDALMFISLTDRPARIHLLSNRALSHLKAGQPNQAICDCESILHLAPRPDHGSKARRDLTTAEAVMKALYIKGMAYKEKGDKETARCDLRLVKELSDSKKDLLVSHDRAHLLQILKDLGAAEQGGTLVAASRLLRRLVEQLTSHMFWSIGPLFLVWGAWVYICVWLCSSADTSKEGLMLDLQRAQTMSAVGAIVLTLLWHSWARWEESQKAQRGDAFRGLREQVELPI